MNDEDTTPAGTPRPTRAKPIQPDRPGRAGKAAPDRPHTTRDPKDAAEQQHEQSRTALENVREGYRR